MIAQLLINSIVAGSIYALMALAMSIIYKASEIPNFGQGEMAMFSTYITFVLLVQYQFSFYFALIGTLIFAFILGFLLEFVFVRRAKEPNLLGFIIITLGFQMILYGFAGWKWGSDHDPHDPLAINSGNVLDTNRFCEKPIVGGNLVVHVK